jgi:UDPglucose 6-dehydrogenase
VLCEAGNTVVCVDIDAAKVARLKAGEVPIHEPGLDDLIRRNCAKGRLRFTTDAARGCPPRIVSIHRGRHSAR